MRYLGGKVRKAKRIAELCEDIAGLLGRTVYVEPFIGGASLFSTSCHRYKAAIGADIQADLIAFWNAALGGWIPPDSMTRETYDDLREHRPDSALCAWAAYAVSYNGKRFAGHGPTASGRDYVAESVRSTAKKVKRMDGANVLFMTCSYEDLPIPPWSIVLADPPYKGTTGYGQEFDSVAFWEWATALSLAGTPVLVTEYTAPDGWVIIDSWSRKSTVDAKKTREHVEIIVVHKSIAKTILEAIKAETA